MRVWSRLATLLSLLGWGCVIPLGQMNPLHVAAQRGDTKTVRDWIAAGEDLNARYDDFTLILAYSEGSRIRNKTALVFAAENGHTEIVRLLVEAGADIYVTSRDNFGDDRGNAFDVAVQYGHSEIAMLLWERSDK